MLRKGNPDSAAKHLGAQERYILEALGKMQLLVPQARMGGLGRGPKEKTRAVSCRNDITPKKGKGAAKAPWEARRGPSGPSSRPAPSGADAPCASAASRPPADREFRSTLGDGGLSCRVRDGIGSIPASVAALAQGAPCASGLPGAPWRPHSVVRETSSSRDRPPREPGSGSKSSGY